MKKVVILSLICIVFASCGKKTTCERFPQEFIENYLPYAENQQVKFTNGVDTINFVVTEVSVWDTYSFEQEQFVRCITACDEPVFVRMVDSEKEINLYYEIRAYNPEANYTNIDVSINLFEQNSWFSARMEYLIPQKDDFGNNIILQGTGAYYCKIEKGKGIVSFENAVSSSKADYWYLVEPQQVSGVNYKKITKTGC